jgi:proteasome accessory factor B
MEITRLYRLISLITLLRSGRRFDADGLAKELEISRRTVFRDLNILTAAGIPYYFDEETGAYTIRQSFFMPAINLTIDEALSLMLATRKMVGTVPLPLFEQASRAAVKIESSLPSAIQDHCGSVMDHVEVRWPAIAGEGQIDEQFRTIRMAVERQRKVWIQYESLFDGGSAHPMGKTIETVLSPYRLVFIHRAWYVIGLSHLHGEVRTMKLSRIVSAKLTEEMFAARPDFSLEEYLGNAWVMIREGKCYEVELIFSPKVAKNVAEVNWHKTQKCEFLPDGSLRFTVNVDGLNEMSWWIMGYGDQVTVKKPAAMVQIVKGMAQRVVEKYSKADSDMGWMDHAGTH